MDDARRAPTDLFARFLECLNRFDDVIVNKRAAGRPKDLADVEALEHRQP